MLWWLLLNVGCTAGAPEAPAPGPRAQVEDCSSGSRRQAAAVSPAPAIPDTAVGRLAALGAPGARPLDLTLVVDRSGSMAEEGRMTFVKRAVDRMTAALRPGDRLNFVVFDNESCRPLTDWRAGRDDVGLVHDAVARTSPRGSTDLSLGLHTGYVAATQAGWLGEEGRDRRLILVTDALLTSDDLDTRVLTEVRRAWEVHHITLWAVAVGKDTNSAVLSQLGEVGGGGYQYLGASAWATSRRE